MPRYNNYNLPGRRRHRNNYGDSSASSFSFYDYYGGGGGNQPRYTSNTSSGAGGYYGMGNMRNNHGNYGNTSFSNRFGYDESLMHRLNERRRVNASRTCGGGGGGGGRAPTRRFYAYTSDDIKVPSTPSYSYDGSGAPNPDPVRTLMVKKVDLNIASNGLAHHTSEYDMSSADQFRPKLVARRGQPFDISVTFNRCYDPVNDDLKLIFQAGAQPMKSKGTSVEVLLSAVDESKKWGAKILANEGPVLTVTVFTPPTLFVGKWNLSIEVVERDDTTSNVYSYEHPDPIYVIFNPWCKDDGVYLGNEELMKEYILNESGKIYVGNAKKISSKPWNFGQFEESILEVALYLLESGGLKWNVRGNPIAVVRKLTAMVNESDDGGVLIGNWSGNYSGGRSPLSWTGSAAILKRYWKDGYPVKFGQCWVFSGVTTTLMRTLGIPARSVTNFASAHDTDGSITIDYHFDSLGEPDESMNDDSIWNFHVWNEVWMARPDLPQGFGGWQAVDATPQEASDGVYVCGPVSIQAIRQGEVNLPYDAPFVFAEVNADIMHWKTNEDGITEPAGLKKNTIGKFISTKACNADEREDITLQYKPPEDSAEERAAVMRANQTGSTIEGVYGVKEEDVFFSVEQDAERTWVGQDFVVGLRMLNSSGRPRTISGRVVVKSMFYTGVTCDKIKSEALSNVPIVLKSQKETFCKAVVKPSDYLDKLKDCCMLDVTFMATVNETGQVFTFKEDFRLRKPHLTIKAPRDTAAGKQFMVDVSFVNPLDRMLTDCVVEVDGLSKDLSFPQSNVAAKGTFATSLPVTAFKKGQKELVLVFSSKQLEDVNGSHAIFVRAA